MFDLFPLSKKSARVLIALELLKISEDKWLFLPSWQAYSTLGPNACAALFKKLIVGLSKKQLYPYRIGRINIASPKLKKRYFSSTAILYAFNIISLEVSALTNITNVDLGRWKFVINPSIALYSKPG